MVTPFTTAVRLITDGTPVDAAHANAPIEDLAQRTQSLNEQLNLLAGGRLLIFPDAPLQAGLPLFTTLFADVDGVFKPARVLLAENAVGGAAALASYVFGVLLSKQTDTLGSIGISGVISGVAPSDWTAVIEEGTFAPGAYFLSATNPGQLTRGPGELAVFVGQMLPDGTFLLRGAPPVYGSHTHYEFALVGKPAGTVVDPTVGNPQSVNTPDATQRGWLPATAPYFQTFQIPAGAKFGYNLAPTAENLLKAVFPPIPLDGATFAQGGLLLDTSKVAVNDYGIWWMDDTYGNAPWPVDYAATTTALDISFWFSRLLFATDAAVVSSLQNHPDSVLQLQFLNAAGAAAASGRLLIKVADLIPNLSDADEGTLAVKSIVNGRHTRGPAVTRLIPGSGINVQATSGNGTDGFFGRIVVTASNSSALQGGAEQVNLANAREDFISDLPMVTLPAGRNVAPVFSIEISKLAPPASKLQLTPWIYSSLGGSLPSIQVQYRIIPPPGTGAALPTSWATAQDLSGTAVTGGQIKQVAIADIPAVPVGAIVLIRLVRSGLSDGFTGNVGIPRLDFLLA